MLRPKQVMDAREEIAGLYMDDKVRQYIVDLVFASREPEHAGLAALKPLIQYGASPRATLALAASARAEAFLRGRGYAAPDDVKSVAARVLRHRITLSYEAEA